EVLSPGEVSVDFKTRSEAVLRFGLQRIVAGNGGRGRLGKIEVALDRPEKRVRQGHAGVRRIRILREEAGAEWQQVVVVALRHVTLLVAHIRHGSHRGVTDIALYREQILRDNRNFVVLDGAAGHTDRAGERSLRKERRVERAAQNGPRVNESRTPVK